MVIVYPLLASSVGCGALRNDIRKLEDKLVQHRIEMRPFFVPVDTSQLNGNRDMPSGFQWAIAVLDSTLPSKGTAYRANRGVDKACSETTPAHICIVMCYILRHHAL